MAGSEEAVNVEAKVETGIESGILMPILQVGSEQAFTPEEVISVLTRFMAGRCDGARQQDGQGFNRLHADFGREMADLPVEFWSARQVWAMRKVLTTYSKTQLAQWWDSVPIIEEPIRGQSPQNPDYIAYKQRQDPTWQVPESYRRLVMTEVEGKPVIELQQSYDAMLIERIKDLPQRKYVPERKIWVVPANMNTLEAVSTFACEYGYDVSSDVEAQMSGTMDAYANRIALSHAKDGDYEINLPDGLELYPFQRIGVQYAQQVKNVLIADQMGLGKTVQGLLTLDVAHAFPAIIVCPASIKAFWAREAVKWLPTQEVGIISGRKPESLLEEDGTCSYNLLIVNYDVLDGWKDELLSIGPKALIADECHKVKNQTATRSKALLHIIQNAPTMRRIFLSGTPVVNRPMEFWTIIRMLGYDKEFGGIGQYKQRYDTGYINRLEELNTLARSYFMIRRLKADVLPELPDKQRIQVPIEIDNRKEYDAAERDIAGYFAKKHTETEEYNDIKLGYMTEAINHDLDGKELTAYVKERMDMAFGAEYNKAYAIASRNEELLRWEALKQLAVKGKMAAVEAWIDEFLESDEKLVVFATHTHVIERLARRYNAPFIRGDVPPEQRLPLVDRFQEDPTCRVIIGNIQAMGEGLTLTAASHVVFCEFGWNPKDHDQAEDRLHRIGQRDNVTVWNLAAENTIDEEIAALIEKKRLIVDAIQDGAGKDLQKEMMMELKASLNARLQGRR